MRKAKRIPRKIGLDDEDETSVGNTPTETSSVVKRPTNIKSNKRFPSHKQFPPIHDDQTFDEVSDSADHRPERHASTRSLAAEQVPLRAGLGAGGPTYSADYLAELKSSTPTVPRDQLTSHVRNDTQELSEDTVDVAAKFGNGALTRPDHHRTSAIPTDLEIQEKKERRRRLAKEQEFISLEGDPGSDSDGDENKTQLSHSLIIPAEELSLKDKYGIANSRLTHDDEDMAEGFDAFVEDPGMVSLGKKAANEQAERRRAEIEAQIRSAQAVVGDGMSNAEEDDEVDAADAIGNTAFDTAQTRFGTYGARNTEEMAHRGSSENSLDRRLKHAPKISPLPEWNAIMVKLRNLVHEKEQSIQLTTQLLDNNRQEIQEVAKEEERIQGLLKEAGSKLEMAQQTNESTKLQDSSRDSGPTSTQPEMETKATFGTQLGLPQAVLGSPSMVMKDPSLGDALDNHPTLTRTTGMSQIPRDESDYDEE